MIPFSKAHACGNDFLIITGEAAAGYDKTELAQRLCERNTSIGADGIAFLEWTGETNNPGTRIRLYNADGSAVGSAGQITATSTSSRQTQLAVRWAF